MTTDVSEAPSAPPGRPRESIVVRFCGDSGDGMQLTGGHFTHASALFGNDVATFPDFPAEIRAPRGTTFGVSGFQVQFSSTDIHTPGDSLDALVAMNPAGLRTNIDDVDPGGLVIVNEDEFTPVNLRKCGYPEGYDPLEDEAIAQRYRLVRVPMSRLTRESLAESGMGAKDVDRCRNMFALGIVSWLFERPLDPSIRALEATFGERKKKPEIAAINVRALRAGWNFGETAELFPERFHVAPAALPPGTYRKISGNEATAIGCAVAAAKAGKQLLYASYPITPASDVLHQLAAMKQYGVRTFQAEDEIAAICAAIGASYAGDLALTGSSGPGIALKGEGLSLAVMLELPLVILDVQRAGPATGMPTKTEQADLGLALWGRPAESPLIVLAARSPADCFATAIEAFRLAVRFMCPVMLLTDGFVANGAEPWRLPDLDAIPPIEVAHPVAAGDAPFLPYARDPETLARPWAIPGTPGLEHRVGGLEKQDGTGAVSYDADNHERMVRLRAEKVQRAAATIPPTEVHGPERGEAILLGWGGTWGAITTAGDRLRRAGRSVATAHLRHLSPLPPDLGEILARYDRVIVPEINAGQLRRVIRDRFLVDAVGINEIRGRMFRVASLVERTTAILDGGADREESR